MSDRPRDVHARRRAGRRVGRHVRLRRGSGRAPQRRRRRGRHRRARVRRRAELHPGRPRVHRAGTRALLEHDPARARALAEAGLRELPDSPGVRYALALAAAANGDDEEARRRLAEAVAGVPELAGEARKDAVLSRLSGS